MSEDRDLADLLRQRLLALGAEPGQRLLVALSGGTDSLALLQLLLSLRPPPWEVTAAHLDHAVRGERSVSDALAVAAHCRQADIPLVAGRLVHEEVRALAKRMRSREGALRALRYRFLEGAADGTGSRWILTAHQADDQSETVLWRVLRGMDWRSLSGIPEIRGRVLRPLLAVPREDLAEAAARLGIRPLEDETNLDLSHSRNLIRHRVLPALEGDFHPGIRTLLRRLGAAAGRLARWERLQVVSAGPPLILADGLPLDSLRRLPPALRRGALVLALERVLGAPPGAGRLRALMRLTEGGGEAETRIGPWRVLRSSGILRLADTPPARPVSIPERPLPVPGVAALPEIGKVLAARWSSSPPAHLLSAGEEAALEAGNIALPLAVRSRRSGDRFRPLGMAHSRKLQDFLVDCKIPRSLRDRIPLVVDAEGEILWVAGIRVSEKARVCHGSRVLILSLNDRSQQGKRGLPL